MSFYHQLKHACAPYGLYLKPMLEIKIGKTLCPETYNGIPISDDRYDQMAACLYQKLASIDTIPLEMAHARNLINRFATENDGYKVMYALVEPILQQDTVPNPPSAADYNDVHEYATQVTAYFNYEAMAGRGNSNRAQTKVFLNGLDSRYQPAITRARHLLDNGNPADPTVPPNLKLSALPNTIDRFMTEETGKPTVRALIDHNTPRDNRKTSEPYKDRRIFRPKAQVEIDRQRSDKICPLCQRTGHTKSQCDDFAKFLIFRDAEPSVDSTTRTTIVTRFRTEMKKKAEIRRKRASLGTIRELWNSGQSFDDAEQALLAHIPDLSHPDGDSSDDECSDE